jgi:methylthioribose-1-phosphate isomerase
MKVNGTEYRTIWMEGKSVYMIDQNHLPWEFSIFRSDDYRTTCRAIKDMTTRGAGAIGAAAGFAMAQAFMDAPAQNFEEYIADARQTIMDTRPTARNLFYAVELVYETGKQSTDAAIKQAQRIAEKDIADSRAIGSFGNELINSGANILTHCNAGWLAFVDYGTALSPVYTAHAAGKEVFVWADETRPRGQGARLTAWELNNAAIPHSIIADTAGASLMAQGKVDMVITGADRIAGNGDTANKIGTLEKAIAAKHFGIPFYVAAPTSTVDLACKTGADIVIEERNPDEVLYQTGPDAQGVIRKIRVASPGSTAFNPAFDVTPASLISGIITEKGIVDSAKDNLLDLLNRL